MSKLVELKNEKPTQADADLAALAGAARLLSNDFVGVPLKYVKGRWFKVISKEEGKVKETVGDTAPFIVDVLSYANGWVKWENNKPIFKYTARPVDGFILPLRRQLPDNDKTKWPIDKYNKPSDPWQENHRLVMKDATTDELVTWTTPSWGGRKAIGRLLQTYTREAKQHPGKMPVVLLLSHDEPNPDFGTIPEPVLKIIDWKDFGDGAAPPGSPMPQPPLALPSATAKITTGPTIDFEAEAEAEADEVDFNDAVPF
jgi:hypothetical protein